MKLITKFIIVALWLAATTRICLSATFSDANWISMNGSIPGADNEVFAALVDGSGNLYIGGSFTVVGDVIANGVAKWNGTNWSALGSGMNGEVYALAVSGNDLFVGGDFTTAGGNPATNIAKWNGSSWSALGSGMNELGYVNALAVSGSDVYAGGRFTAAGGSAARFIAKWNGSMVAGGFGAERRGECAGGVGRRPVCGRLFPLGDQ